MNIDKLADRHFRPDPQGVLKPGDVEKRGRVLLTITESIVNTSGGQHMAWMLVNLLARQLKVVSEITLIIPDALLLEDTAAFGKKPSIQETLEECVKLVAGEHIKINTPKKDDEKFDMHLGIGGLSSIDNADSTLCIYADGWRWYVGNGSRIPINAPKASSSFGPYLAACLAAGEAFKYLRGMRKGKGEFITELFGSVWTQTTGDSWEELVDGPNDNDLPVLPHFYFAGAGAVAQSAALVLGSSKIQGDATAIDHDELELTNGNRYVLSTIDDNEEVKVEILSTYLSSKNNFSCHPVQTKWSNYSGASGAKAKNSEIKALERKHQFPMVLSCVDKNIPRHEIQKLLPHLIIGGSTDGLVAKVQVFYLGHDSACLKCYNPVEDRNAIIEKNKDRLRIMSSSQREEWCADRGISDEVVKAFLLPPECGKLSENDLDNFSATEPEMSVGFVSVAAGIMLSAQMIRVTFLGVDDATCNGHTIVLTFSRPGLQYLKIGPEANCDCNTVLRKKWNKIWNN